MSKFLSRIIFLALLCLCFQTTIFALADEAPSPCTKNYPTGQGSGTCIIENDCTDEKAGAPVEVVRNLCPGEYTADKTKNVICCKWVNDPAAASASAASCPNGSVCLANPLAGGQTDVPSLVSKVIKGLLGTVGALALLMFVWGGFTWMSSAGNPERVKSGTMTMIWAAIGVVFVFISYTLLSIFTKFLSGG